MKFQAATILTLTENASADVTWVKKRLKRFSCWPTDGDEDGNSLTGLVDAVRRFQSEYVPEYRGRGSNAPGWITRHGTTAKKLKARPPSTAASEAAPMNERFLRAVRERDPNGTTKVVSGLNIPIAGGSTLFTSGFGPRGRSELTQCLHWEMFSHVPLLGEHPHFEDTQDDLVINGGAEPIVEAARREVEDLTHTSITSVDVQSFYQRGIGAFLRDYQAKFKSEWSMDPAIALEAFRRQGIGVDGVTPSQVAPLMWWNEAADVLPPSHVWHYNPIYVTAEIAEHSRLFVGSIEVVVTHRTRRTGNVIVSVVSGSRPVQPDEEVSIWEPTVVAVVPPGPYRIFVTDPAAATSSSAPPTDVIVEIAQTRQVEIQLPP